MLIRSMFEDVIVAHWLLLHEDEGDFYGERLLRHQHAMYLAADRVSKRYGAPTADLSTIRDQEAAGRRVWAHGRKIVVGT